MNFFEKIKNRRFFKYGIPFFVLVLGGSFGLQELTSIRYKFRKQHPIKPEEVEKLGIKMKKPGEVTLESEWEKIKDMDIDHWENIRGPRPWEEKPAT